METWESPLLCDDDANLITLDWLESMGFVVNPHSHNEVRLLISHMDVTFTYLCVGTSPCNPDNGAWFFRLEAGEACSWENDLEDACWLPNMIQTRGPLRRLVAALTETAAEQ